MPRPSPTRRRLRQLRRQVTPVLPFVVGACVVVLLSLAYVAARGLDAARHSNTATTALSRVESDLKAGDVEAARVDAGKAADAAQAASHDTGGLVWHLVGVVPGIRGPMHSVRTTTDVLRDVADHVVAPVVQLPTARLGDLVSGTSVEVDSLAKSAPTLRAAAQRVAADLQRLQGVSTVGMPAVDREVSKAAVRLGRVERQLQALAATAQLAPTMLADGRSYLVLVQNNAESRATGGLVGAYALMRVTNQRLTLVQAGPDNDLRDAPSPLLKTSSDFAERYGGLGVTTSWRSLNLTPDFPTAAQIAARLWGYDGHPAVDGVIAVDPPALAQLLRVTGSISVPGGPRIDAANAVSYLESGIYRTYPRSADAARNRFLAAVTRAVFDEVESRSVPGVKLVNALGRAASDGHVQLWSAHADEQAVLASTRVADSLADRPAPFLEVVTQNLTGGKVDYYLRRQVSYVSTTSPVRDDVGAGPVAQDDAIVTVRLTNTAPAHGLPAYVTTRADLPKGTHSVVGTDRLWLSLYFAGGTGYTAATLDGQPIGLHTDDERGTSVMSTVVELKPGQSVVLQLHVLQPAPTGSSFTYFQQPLAVPDSVVVRRS